MSALVLIFLLLYVTCLFFIAAFKISLLVFIFPFYYDVSWWMLVLFLLFEVFWVFWSIIRCLFLLYRILSYYFFKYYFCPVISLFSCGLYFHAHSIWYCVLLFILGYFILKKTLYVFIWIISVDLSSNSRSLYSSASILLHEFTKNLLSNLWFGILKKIIEF